MWTKARVGFGALAAGLATVMLATTAAAAPTPGAPGVGDPYYPGAGNGGYNVGHYDIRLTYQPKTDELSGQTTIKATATQDLSRFNLDFGLTVSAITVNDAAAEFATDPADPSELIVTPSSPVAKGQSLRVLVKYSGIPSTVVIEGRYTAWTRTATGGFAVSQPRVAEWWFPSSDHPSDKATFAVSAEVPDGTSALSNGVLAGKDDERPGWTRWNWKSKYPMATYLAFIALGEYEVHQSTWRGKPYITAYDESLKPEWLATAKEQIGTTPEVTDFLSDKFGPYPFEAIGGVAVNGIGYAIENQTRPAYGTSFWDLPEPGWVIAHEQAHQWFGDSVSVADWSHMWLNEGFATYAEWLWSEERGLGTADQLAQAFYEKYPADDPFWQVVVADPKKIFESAVYERGAMALHALRGEVGDRKFFEILRSWHKLKKGGNATTAEFIARAERVAGEQLDELFETWIYAKGKPATSPNGADVQVKGEPKSFDGMVKLHKHFVEHGHGQH
ncbi:M1 family metallopeptidase [Stackebrandtia nassauensis]